jgi:hypothetical protein
VTAGLDSVAAIALGAFGVFALALLLFMGTVQPIWCVVDCAVDRRRSGVSKGVWIVVLILLYGLANWFYGAFAATGPWLRRITRVAWLIAIVLLIAFMAMYNMSEGFRRGFDHEMRSRDLVVLAPAR